MSCDDDKNAYAVTAWGPIAWHHLHTVGFAFPKNPTFDERENMKLFVRYFAKTLPCEECRVNFEDIIFKTFKDVHVKNCDILSRYLFFAHNLVNKKLGKKVIPNTKYEDVRDYYQSMRHLATSTKIKLILN